MANWTGGRLTKAGNDLQIKVEAGQCKLELMKIKLGDGTEGIDAVDNLTDLVGPKAVFGISSVVAKDGMCTVTGIISSSNVTAAFYAREWGLFAKDPDLGEILYMISLDPNPESIPPKTAALKQAATYAMNIVVSNAANIEVRIDPAGLVNVAMLAASMSLLQRGTTYQVGDIANDAQLARCGFRLECVRAGTTAATLPNLSDARENNHITDGTVEWIVGKTATLEQLTKSLTGKADCSLGNILESAKTVIKDAVITRSLLAENGYIVFANGLIVQWGCANVRGDEQFGSAVVSLPIRYNSAHFSCVTVGDGRGNVSSNTLSLEDFYTVWDGLGYASRISKIMYISVGM